MSSTSGLHTDHNSQNSSTPARAAVPADASSTMNQAQSNSSRDTPQTGTNSARVGGGPGAKSGMASATPTGANSALGKEQPKMMDAEGAIGKQFTEQGALGGAAQAIGGPLAKDGVIGKQFTTEGAVGGTVQNAMGGKKPGV